MPKNLTRHRRANKRGGQVAPMPPMPPAPAMPAYGAPMPVAAEEEDWTAKLKGYIPSMPEGMDPRSWWSSANAAPSSAPSAGGRRRMRAMRGGEFHASDPLSLATNASPISGISSARAHNWIGGRTRGRGRTRSRALRRSQRRTHARSRSRKYGRARH